jgi:hypothetical protein
MVNKKPFTEEYHENENIVTRIFDSNTNELDLKWHWDNEDRIIELLEESDWEFQFDNMLPIKFYDKIFIPKGTIHRVIKGTYDLKIKIYKN